jgi:hypothetical protein
LFGIAKAVQASIPDSNGTFHLCYNNNTGALRVIDPKDGRHCHPGETAVNLNPNGHTGATGATGTSGPSGPSGPQGPAIGTKIFTSTDTDINIVGCAKGPIDFSFGGGVSDVGPPCADHHFMSVSCPGSTLLLSGGWTSEASPTGPPWANGGDVYADKSYPSGSQTWVVDLMSVLGATHVNATVYAVCTT